MFGVLQDTKQGHLNQFGVVSSPLRGKQWFTDILNLEGVAQSTDGVGDIESSFHQRKEGVGEMKHKNPLEALLWCHTWTGDRGLTTYKNEARKLSGTTFPGH